MLPPWLRSARVLAALALGLPLAPRPAAAQAGRDSAMCALVARSISLPATLAALDSANGFGAYRFGTPIEELPEPLTGLVVRKHGQLAFVAPLVVADLGGLLVSSIGLVADAGRLTRINFGPVAERHLEALLRTLRHRYGPGQRIGLLRYAWPGQVVTLVYETLITTRGTGINTVSYSQGLVYVQNNALAAEAQARRKRWP